MADKKLHRIDKSTARAYLGKAKQFLAASQAELTRENHDSCLLLAIHAGISAADAVSVALGGVRSTDPDHLKAADLLEEIAIRSTVAKEQANKLRALIKQKNLVEYEDRRTTSTEAGAGAKRAERLVDWASEVVARANL